MRVLDKLLRQFFLFFPTISPIFFRDPSVPAVTVQPPVPFSSAPESQALVIDPIL